MTTTEAIKFCFPEDVYKASNKYLSKPELLKLACLVAFENQYGLCYKSNICWQVNDKLIKSLKVLRSTGIFED